MGRVYTLEQRQFMLLRWNHLSSIDDPNKSMRQRFRDFQREFVKKFSTAAAPTRQLVDSVTKQFAATSSLAFGKPTGRPKSVCDAEKVAAVKRILAEQPDTPVSTLRVRLRDEGYPDICRSSVYRILQDIFKHNMSPYQPKNMERQAKTYIKHNSAVSAEHSYADLRHSPEELDELMLKAEQSEQARESTSSSDNWEKTSELDELVEAVASNPDSFMRPESSGSNVEICYNAHDLLHRKFICDFTVVPISPSGSSSMKISSGTKVSVSAEKYPQATKTTVSTEPQVPPTARSVCLVLKRKSGNLILSTH